MVVSFSTKSGFTQTSHHLALSPPVDSSRSLQLSHWNELDRVPIPVEDGTNILIYAYVKCSTLGHPKVQD